MLTAFRSVAAIWLGMSLFACLTSCTSDADHAGHNDLGTSNSVHTAPNRSAAPLLPRDPARDRTDDSETADPPTHHDRLQTTNRWYV